MKRWSARSGMCEAIRCEAAEPARGGVESLITTVYFVKININ